MTISNWILPVFAILIVVLGWGVTANFNRKHAISIRRTDHRIDTLKNFISFYIKAQNAKSLDGFNGIQVEFYLYGYDDEIELVQEIARLVTTKGGVSQGLELLPQLNVLCRNNLRKELELPLVKN